MQQVHATVGQGGIQVSSPQAIVAVDGAEAYLASRVKGLVYLFGVRRVKGRASQLA